MAKIKGRFLGAFLGLLLLLIAEAADDPTRENLEKIIGNDLMGTEDLVKKALIKITPHVIAVRSPAQSMSSTPEPMSTAYLEKHQKGILKGLKSNVLYCEEYPKEKPLLNIIAKAFCSRFEEEEFSSNDWIYISVPYVESQELSETDFTGSDVLESQWDEVITQFIHEKLGIEDNDGKVTSARETFNSYEEAANKALKSYPDIVFNLEEEKVPDFITNTFRFGGAEVKAPSDDVVVRKTYPVIFFSDDKMTAAPQLFIAFSNILHGLIKCAFVHHPSSQLLTNFGLPAEFQGQNFVLIFDSDGAQIVTYMYNRQTYGKYSALSLSAFAIGMIQGQFKGPTELNPFLLWSNVSNNRLRLPVDFKFDSSQNNGDSSAQKAEDVPSSGSIEFTKNELKQQTTTEEFESQCLDNDSSTSSICIIGVFDRFGPDAQSQLETFSQVQDMIYELESLLGKDRMLKFKFNFGWLDSVCNKDIISRLGLDPTAVPTITAVFNSETNKKFTHLMVGSYSKDNAIGFVKDTLKYRSLLWHESGSKYEKYIGRFKMLKAENLEALKSLEIRETCDEGAIETQDEEDVDDMLKEIREEEKRAAEKLKQELKEEEEAKLLEKTKSKKKKKKKGKKKKKSKSEL